MYNMKKQNNTKKQYKIDNFDSKLICANGVTSHTGISGMIGIFDTHEAYNDASSGFWHHILKHM